LGGETPTLSYLKRDGQVTRMNGGKKNKKGRQTILAYMRARFDSQPVKGDGPTGYTRRKGRRKCSTSSYKGARHEHKPWPREK